MEVESARARPVRQPADIPVGTPIRKLAEQHAEHLDRLATGVMRLTGTRRTAKGRGETGDRDNALAALALGNGIARELGEMLPQVIRRAILLGANRSEATDSEHLGPAVARPLPHP